MSSAARLSATTIRNYLREEEVGVFRKRPVYAMLEDKGLISLNNGGKDFQWEVRFREHDIQGNTGETARTFAATNLWQNAVLGWRGYQVTDQLTNKDLAQNQGEQALIKLANKFMDRLKESLASGLGSQMYIDGNATGNELKWHGINSFMGGTQTVDKDSGSPNTRAADDVAVAPSDTYAGLSTALANYGGAVPSGTGIDDTWPNGECRPETDFWSPVMIAYDSTSLSGSTQNFTENGPEAARYVLTALMRNEADAQVDVFVLGRALYRRFMDKLDAKERVEISSNTGVRKFGFQRGFMWDGVEFVTDYDCPANTGFALTTSKMELLCQTSSFFEVDEPDYDIDTQATKYAVWNLGNLKFASPRYFGKLTKYSGSAYY